MITSGAVMGTLLAIGDVVGAYRRSENNPARRMGTILNTVVDATSSGLSYIAASTYKNNLIPSDDPGAHCSMLTPSEVQTCKSLLITVGLLNVYALCRAFYSTWR